MGFSLVALIDGSLECSEKSYLGYAGLPIWIFLTAYLMYGLYVVCEFHFVPSLQIVGNKLGLSEDAQGATIMAAGSSSPEFFTALIGVLFYPKENPGPGTIIGSAVFNVCVIVASCALFMPRDLYLNKASLYRDSISYLLAAVMLIVFYSGITPGRIDMWESGMMVLAYALYSIVVCRRSFVVEPVANMCARVISVLNMSEDNVRFTMVDEEGGDRQAIELGNVTSNTERTESMEKMEEEFKNSSGPEGLELKLPGGLEEKVNPEMKEDFQEERRGSLDSLEVPLTMSHHQNHGREQKRQPSTGWARWLTRGFDVLKFPLQMAFKYTIPNPDSFNFQYCFVLTFAMSVVWLALLTFLVVDLSEKFGTCIGISEDLIGLSVLAVGSSLPDCISSVLIAMECKGDMAVCNALGSNCFDILLCLGATFFLQSCLQNGASIQVENDPAFDSLILLLFIIQGVFNGIIAWSGHYLRRWHGYTLLVVYFLFVIYFFLDYEVIDPETK